MGMHCSSNKEDKEDYTLTIDQFKPAAEFLVKTVNSYFLYFIGKFGNASFHIQTQSFISSITFSFWLPLVSYSPTLVPLLKFFPISYEIFCWWVNAKFCITFTANRLFRKWELSFFLKAYLLLVLVFYSYLKDIQSCSHWLYSVPRTFWWPLIPLFLVLLWK